MPCLEIIEIIEIIDTNSINIIVLIHCNIVNIKIQESCIHMSLISQLLDISPKNFIFSKTFNSEFLYIEVWFTDQNSKPLEIEDKINIPLVFNQNAKYKKWRDIQFNLEIEHLQKAMNFFLLLEIWLKILVKI